MGDSATFQLEVYQFIHAVLEIRVERPCAMAGKKANITRVFRKGKEEDQGSASQSQVSKLEKWQKVCSKNTF